MPHIIIIKKFIYYSLMVGSFPVIAQATMTAAPTAFMSSFVVIALMAATLMPEGLLIFGGYRREIVKAIQDNDGETSRDDLRFAIQWYMPFSCIRGLIFGMLYSMVQPEWFPPDNIVYGLIAGATTTAVKPALDFFKGEKKGEKK